MSAATAERVTEPWATPERKFAVRDVLRLWRQRWPSHDDRLNEPQLARRYLFAVEHATPAQITAAGDRLSQELRTAPPTVSEWAREFPRPASGHVQVAMAFSALVLRWGGPALPGASIDDPDGVRGWEWLASAMRDAGCGMALDASLQSVAQVTRNLAVLGANTSWWDAACDPVRRRMLCE